MIMRFYLKDIKLKYSIWSTQVIENTIQHYFAVLVQKL